ncbi:hypothetical protein CYMTET_42804 [Cymbomonas tetramitiformis]|uniref:DUF7148 domain-containing protein n=1 Tax=Cymbomonas tetramitiformis TaxID=36881 RepID=A0AAE0F2A1_9CHLO|nr:hypothetical protein CYMTET_42804 [Cymbomonas tetramitiformis]
MGTLTLTPHKGGGGSTAAGESIPACIIFGGADSYLAEWTEGAPVSTRIRDESTGRGYRIPAPSELHPILHSVCTFRERLLTMLPPVAPRIRYPAPVLANSTLCVFPVNVASAAALRALAKSQHSATTQLTKRSALSKRPARTSLSQTHALFGRKSSQPSDEPTQLASAKLGSNVDANELLGLLRGWAHSLNASSVSPLQLSLKVDSIEAGVRMALIEVDEGRVVELVHYDLTITPSTAGGHEFLAFKKGALSNLTPPDEAAIFMQLKTFLTTAILQCLV